MVVMIRRHNVTGRILEIAETDAPDSRAVGHEGPGESVVSVDADVWAALKQRVTASGRWYLVDGDQVVKYVKDEPETQPEPEPEPEPEPQEEVEPEQESENQGEEESSEEGEG